ncbi:ATP-binding cassette domain-containing protein [Lactovum odontotermitis]
MIHVENISKKLKKKMILSEVSLDFDAGKIYGLKGRNGAGKTMLIRAIAGLIRVDTGQIRIMDKVLGKDIDFPPSLGLLIENANVLPDFSLTKNLTLLAKIKKITTADGIRQAIIKVGLDPDDKQPVRRYSLGMKQRAALAQAIFEKPDLILLDEPTNAIDVAGVSQVREILLAEKARGATIIIASHNEEDLKLLADEIIYMAEGRVSDYA